jgi:hypothetical protein
MKITNTEKIIIGNNLADILLLKVDKGYNPERYITNWGNKTSLGIYETVKRILEDKEFRIRKPVNKQFIN